MTYMHEVILACIQQPELKPRANSSLQQILLPGFLEHAYLINLVYPMLTCFLSGSCDGEYVQTVPLWVQLSIPF